MEGVNKQKKIIYIACPWAPMGGGMYKIADYLIQSQYIDDSLPTLKPLDSRGGGKAIFSVFMLFIALFKILIARLSGSLLGLHVNVAERLSLFRKSVLILFAKVLGVPVVLHLHAAQLPSFYQQLPAFAQRLVRKVFQSADKCIVLGEKSKKFVIDVLGVNPKNIDIVINGVPRVKLEDVFVNNKNKKGFNILFLGNLMERKGVSDLLKALASQQMLENNKWKAFIAGGGDIDGYKMLAHKLGLAERVIFIGWADQKKASELMSQADVLILPSYDEGLPLVILEALGGGVPVICTPVGEIPDFFNHKEQVYFVQPGDILGIGHAILDLMSNDILRSHLSMEGERYYNDVFAFDVFMQRIYTVYSEVFDQPQIKAFVSRKG